MGRMGGMSMSFDPVSYLMGQQSAGGGGGGGGLVPYTDDPDNQRVTLDKTYNEIAAMVENGVLPYIILANEIGEEVYEVLYLSNYSAETDVQVYFSAIG